MDDTRAALDRAHAHALDGLDSAAKRGVNATATAEQLVGALDGPLPDGSADPAEVVDALVAAVEPGLVATTSGRFFGFVIGGTLPAALAADWLTGVWDQNAAFAVLAPAEAAVESVAARWLLDLLGLPPTASVGFVTGCTAANFTCLAAGRHHVLASAGWDVGADGLTGAPKITVLASEDRHVSVDAAVRYLGLGSDRIVNVRADGQGRIRVDALAAALRSVDGPVIVCLQAGNANTGSCDPFQAAIQLAKERSAWVHVDGAFGLWAGAASSRRHLVAGVEGADSWATDAHKWLNVPYDCGLAIVANPRDHVAAMGAHASYLVQGGAVRDQFDLVPELSRRARGPALRSLGRSGVANLVQRCCTHAQKVADGIAAIPGAQVLNDVVLNQVLARFHDADAATREVVRRVLADGTAFMTGTTFHGEAAMRISVSNWSTTQSDVNAALAALRRIIAEVGALLVRH